MPESTVTDQPPSTAPAAPPDAAPPGRIRQAFGPLTAGRVVVLIVAFVFLAGAVGFTVGHRQAARDPLSAVDVGFLRDMSYHHEQAVQMSLLLLGKPGIDTNLRSFAQEVLLDQRYEAGIMQATLDRFGHDTRVGSRVMAWMGPALAPDQMPGLASPAEMARLRSATGGTASSLWIALMSRHHLGGIHMADFAARRGHDARVRNLALAMAKNQRSEIVDFGGLRQRLGLPIPAGYTDPTKDPGLAPLALTAN
ncbi:MAG: hypothetical protein JWN46_3269 [Acidimicrobiales bacterium]|nr:hypothetical protein [Acidimicrobiales bacterium]